MSDSNRMANPKVHLRIEGCDIDVGDDCTALLREIARRLPDARSGLDSGDAAAEAVFSAVMWTIATVISDVVSELSRRS